MLQDNIRTLLDVAIELPDSEFLLQKHFTALLTSVWRMKSHTRHRQNHLPYRFGHYSTGRFFSSAVNQISWNSAREPTERTNWNNLGYISSRLVASALHDANDKQHDDSAFLSNRREEASTVPEYLEIRLEIGRDIGDSLVPLPSVINLSILGSEPPSPVNNPKEESQSQILKFSQDMADNRFRYGFVWELSICFSRYHLTNVEVTSSSIPSVFGHGAKFCNCLFNGLWGCFLVFLSFFPFFALSFPLKVGMGGLEKAH